MYLVGFNIRIHFGRFTPGDDRNYNDVQCRKFSLIHWVAHKEMKGIVCPGVVNRVSQEERPIFWEVILSYCPIPNGFRDRAI